MHENNSVLSCVNNEQINEPVLESNLCTCAMARRRLSNATRWQIIGMSNAGLSRREISRRLGYSQSVICRLLNKFQQTNHVQDREAPKDVTKGRRGVTETCSANFYLNQYCCEAKMAAKQAIVNQNSS